MVVKLLTLLRKSGSYETVIAKQDKKKIALDSNVFLYVLLGQEPFSTHAAQALKDIESSNELTGIFSVLAFTEVLGEKSSKQALIGHRLLGEMINMYALPIDESIARKAGHLRTDLPSLRSADALHLATALRYEAAIFITNDTKLKTIASDLLPTKDLRSPIKL